MNSAFEARFRQTIDRCVIWSEIAQVDRNALGWFDPGNPAIAARKVASGGRGASWYVTVAGQHGVLRQYRRGGWMASVNRDCYWWRNEREARCFREYAIMAQLAAAGLAVPAPMAAMACRLSPFFYRAAIITRRVLAAGTLASSQEPGAWHAAGVLIARMHREGVWHADLNVHNILVQSPEQVWLIDFDKAQAAITAPEVLAQNLVRLHRSVRKHCPQNEAVLWPMLNKAYAAAIRTACPGRLA